MTVNPILVFCVGFFLWLWIMAKMTGLTVIPKVENIDNDESDIVSDDTDVSINNDTNITENDVVVSEHVSDVTENTNVENTDPVPTEPVIDNTEEPEDDGPSEELMK